MAPDTITPSRLPKRFRTILHGTCLLAGKHPPGSALARECPLAKTARRSAARRQAWLTRKAQTGAPPQPGTGERP
jgi:hypothetical protein